MDLLALSSSPVCSGILKDVVAYVEVWSSNRTENYSKTFSQQLHNLGAKISKTFNKQVTHVVFKDGNQGTWAKAVKTGVKLVSVLWVEKCIEAAEHVEESLFPAMNMNAGLPDTFKKKRKCMQPKDFVEKTPENDKRLQRKLDRMVKELDEQKVSVDVPVLLFDEDGTLMYSPKAVVSDRSNAMEKRLKEMKNKRENLSPTASQMTQTFDFPPLKPSIGNSPSVSRDSLHDTGGDSLDTSYEDLWGSIGKIQEIKDTSKIMKKAEGKKCASGSKLEDKRNCSLNSSKGFDLPKYGNITEDNNSVTKLSCDKLKSKNETLALDRKSLPDKPIAKCKQKGDFKKRRSTAATPTKCSSVEKSMTARPCESLHLSDSEDSCSSFEDFFSSSNLKSHKTLRFSLGTLPRKSPSPPTLTSSKKRSKRRRSAEIIGQVNMCSSKKRKTDSTKLNTLLSKPVLHSEFSLDSNIPSPDDKNVDSNTNLKKINVSHKNRTSVEKKNIFNLLEEAEVTVGEDGNVVKDFKIVPVSSIGRNMCLVKGVEEILNSATWDKTLETIDSQEKSLGLKSCTDMKKQEDQQMKRFSQSVQSKTYEHNAVDGLSEMFNEQKNKCAKESKQKEKSRKISGSLVMTSMCAEKQNAVIQVVKKFGGFVFSDHVCKTTTHVIAGSPRRTLNIILGIARGCWILSYDWVLWSLEHGQWLPEEPYELSDDFPGAPICRLQHHLSAGEYQPDLLSDVPTVFISPCSQPPCDKLSEVVQLCGGKVSKTLRKAKICIGQFNGKKTPDMQSISEKWLLDSITQHKLLPLENYLLEP
ncbi:microcephalin [Bombina bombina]|uniref:microcephalin n=1 Tax=Bombina bombina TaxID=8345 RepID=UPI00235AB8C2|nr:microcephalin [Bombina bombina]